MARYDDIRANERFSKLSPASSAELAEMRREGVPADYLDFLSEIGSGSIGDSSFSLYSGLVLPDEVYDAEAAKTVGSVLLFGDDYQGYCFGFAPDQDWAVVEVDPTDHSTDVVAPTFEQFVHTLLIPRG